MIMKQELKQGLLTGLVSLSVLSLALSGCAQSEPTPLEMRIDTMKDWRDAMTIMGEMIKAPEKFDATQFKAQADYLATDANTPWPHFAQESPSGKSAPNVWSDASGFAAQIEKYQQATVQLSNAAADATSTADVSASYTVVNDACKSCHNEYKLDVR